MLNLLSLEHRRILFDVLFLYKGLNGYINIDLSTNVQFSQILIGILEGEKMNVLKKNYARSNTFKFRFFSRVVDMWNTLPWRLRQATTISSLKKGVREFLAGNL